MSIKVPAKTLKIQSKTAGRLSPDLANIATFYEFKVDKKRRKLTLDGNTTQEPAASRLKTWLSGKSQSRYISLKTVVEQLGMTPEELAGKLYDVSVDGKVLEVTF